ncbi:YqeG family HAD IIIA-type phosphatase [uncultured Dysosmobacter sp.]|uniref:YqeG family HAD IIIA-type phosphatase n=1 Tax=uncultured Dysosmobacter sp. TaxID=2591384 RepID=UPI0026383686|nr:YqeG family HAD IIIA-type phosphatase [uncultured Dysosmobacter sp.]
MPFSLIPHRLFDRYDQITPAYLRERGITLLLSDLDFTLAAKSTRRPDQPLRDWIAGLGENGVQFMIVSNNRSGTRVTEFCAELSVPYQGRAGKPSPRGLETAMARAGADRTSTAMLGDKLLTDVLAANRAGVLALMVEPVGGAVTLWQKVLHALQAPFKAACRRRCGKRTEKNQ